MDLDRQQLPARPDGRPEPPQRVPELRPPVLGDWFIYLSVVVLFAGVIAITALSFGVPLASGFARFPALVAVGLLIPLSADAAVRSWRSAWVWLPIDRPRGLSRFVWAAVLATVFVVSVVGVLYLVSA